jgi:hypothetical protein
MPLGLQLVLSHKAAELFAVHDHALVAKSSPDTPISVALELVADCADADKNVTRSDRSWQCVIEVERDKPFSSHPLLTVTPKGR